MELLKVSASAGLLPSSQSVCLVPSSPTEGLCSFSQLNLPVAPSSIFHGLHFNSKKSDQERLLGNFQRLRAMQCNAPVIARTYFLRTFKRSPDRMDGELESLPKGFFPCKSRAKFASWVCFAKGPRPRKPRLWKSRPRIGTVSKSHKLVEHVKALSNVKEEVYGALDAFIAWEVEFPLITIKKALKTLEAEKEWKRIIQITKWMLSKGQGKTMGSYYLLLNALAEERRIKEAEELWMQIFRRHLECVPKMFFTRVISMYEQNNMTDKLLEIFADMEELGVRPDHLAVTIVANAFKNLGMIDKYEKLLKKYPQTNWEHHVCKGYRYRVPVQTSQNSEDMMQHIDNSENGAEKDKSAKDDFASVEYVAQQNKISMSLEKDPNSLPISI